VKDHALKMLINWQAMLAGLWKWAFSSVG